MISVETVRKESIRSHYQLGTLFYRMLWGPNIHHGLWDGNESPREAQDKLTDTLADLARIGASDKVVDIGCGMGGASLRLASQRQCEVVGVTISSVQKKWATFAACVSGRSRQCRFINDDAERVVFEPESVDVVWSVECTEHLFDKPAFFQRACSWLRPGGRVAICVWFEGERTDVERHDELCEEVCHRFVCPSLATRLEYAQWLEQNGLKVIHNEDWTERVAETWEICKRRVHKFGIRHLAKCIDKEQVDFIDGFDALLTAYRTGAMQYGAIVAEKIGT